MSNIVSRAILSSFLALCFCATTFSEEKNEYSRALASNQMSDADVEFLIDGVEGIGQAGVPGPVCVFGPNARAIIASKLGKTQAALVAATKYKKGRAVAFGHGGYLSKSMLTKPGGSERLLQNILRWLSNNSKSPTITVVDNKSLAELIRYFGYQVLEVKNLKELTESKSPFQVLIFDAGRLSEDQVSTIGRFVADGGGVLSASLGWGWLQVSGKTDLKTEHTGNRLLAPMGLVWTDGYFRDASKRDGENFFPVTPDGPSKLLNVSEVIAALDRSDKLSPEEAALAIDVLSNGFQAIPDIQGQKLFAPLKKLSDKEIVPTPKNQIVKAKMIPEVLAITLKTEEYLKSQIRSGLPKSGVPALSAGSDFPGEVPKNAKTVTKAIAIDTTIPDWHSTALYAAPGATITVKAPKDCVAANGKNCLEARIGCHKDQIWHQDKWSRWPEITLAVPLRQEETKLANPFGGLVYITVPNNFKKGIIDVEISGAVEAPLYVHGKTSLDDWKKTIRNAPAPWGELASDRLILSVPSQHLRALDDPDAVMEFWNKVLDACADLCGQPIKRKRPERIVCDRQISAGYMHSGYPVMTWMDVQKRFIDLKDNMKDGWGFYHEFGHNHQAPRDWTFDGTVEVTVNLFSLYVFETVCNIPREKTRRELTKDWQEKKRKEFFAKGSPFETWKKDPFLALAMYVDMIDAFGWDAFKNVFREYRTLSNEQRPKNDDEKRDQWMVRMSRQVGKNLGPYFDQWGVPVSKSAKDSIKDLPVWEPYKEIEN